MKHTNNGKCEKCLAIINRYPNFNRTFLSWFMNLQKQHPEAHVSEAGRGRDVQEAMFQKKASRAHYGESAHNYNAALDIFELDGDPYDIYEKRWFDKVIKPNLIPEIVWYGSPGSKFWELPHVELKGWRELAKSGTLKLVESNDDAA